MGTRKTDIIGLGVWVVLTFSVAAFARQFEPGVWYYDTIQKPSWTPPGWVFGPVWGLLYIAMSIAVWLMWRKIVSRARRNYLPLLPYLLQLLLNGLWSWLFFGRHLIGIAAIDLALLVIVVAVTVVVFYRGTRPAGILLIPYLLWISFAFALNFQIWRINSAGG